MTFRREESVCCAKSQHRTKSVPPKVTAQSQCRQKVTVRSQHRKSLYKVMTAKVTVQSQYQRGASMPRVQTVPARLAIVRLVQGLLWSWYRG
eukprot:2491131-Rhodomonas_salina.1